MQLSIKFILLITITAMISLANGKESIGNHIVTAVQQPTVTQNVPARAKHKRIVKSKFHRTVPFSMGDQYDDYDSAMDLQVAYRRPEVVKVTHDADIDNDEELSSHITDRLAQIRELALSKYREVHG